MPKFKLNIPKLEKSWEELIRSDMRVYTVTPVLRSIRYSNLEIGGPKYRSIMFYIQNKVGFYYENFQDHHRVGKYLLEKFLTDSSLIKTYVKKWKTIFNDYQKTIAEIRRINISKLTDKEIGGWIKKIYEEFSYFHGIAYNVDAIDIVLNPVLESEITKMVKDKINPNPRKSLITEYYNKLTIPDTPTFSWQKEFDFLKLAELYSSRHLTDIDLKNYVEKYFWAEFNWGICQELTILKLKKQIRKTAKTSRKSSQDLLKANSKKLKEKRAAIKNLNPSQHFLQLLEIYDIYSHLHDLRKEGQMKGVYYLDRLMLELVKRCKISPELLSYAWPEEIINLAKTGKIDIAKLKQRAQEFFVVYTQKETKEYYGRQAQKLREMKLNINLDKKVDLQGIAASKGRVVGKARVCLGGNEANSQLKQGEILVTGMTTPDFVPAMRKALAIVTDEGGITCHAAIISRELGVPCIVGTKFATRILKSGDYIEVNANHGVVKKVG